MDFNPEEIPCRECICLAICKSQDVNDLLNKCPNLKTYMEIDLDHFDNALDFLDYKIAKLGAREKKVHFKLTDEEVSKYQDWLEEHNKKCPIHYEGAIGGKITFSFTQTGLGCFAKVSCACGEELLLTNIEEF